MTPKRPRDAASSNAPSAKRQHHQQQRRNGSTPPNNNTRLSAGDNELARLQQETLRISNEMLRSENEQLQVELEILEESNNKLEKKVAASQQRVQVLEGDLARWYRTQKRDAEIKQAEHTAEVAKLQDQLDALLKHSGLAPRTSAAMRAELQLDSTPGTQVENALPLAATVPPKAAQEVDAFLATCMQWQANLTTASVSLEKQVLKIEESEITSVVSNVVAQVEIAAREDQVAEKEHECEAMRLMMLQQQRELEHAMQKLKQERVEADAFEALERRIMEDRVAELEVQLTQNRLREFEKDEEITNLRKEQDELCVSNCVIPKTEWEAHLVEHQRLGEEADEWRHKCETQSKEVTRLQDELRAVNSKLQEAEGRLQSVQALEEMRAFETLEKRILEERIEELETQLRSQQKQQPHIDDDVETEQEQRLVKLTEDLEAAQLQLSVAEAESHVKKNEVARLLNDKAELKRQVKILAADSRKFVLHAEEYKAQVETERQRTTQLAEEIRRLRDVYNVAAVQQGAQLTDEHAKLQQEVLDLKEQQQQLRAQVSAEKDVVAQCLERKDQEQVEHDERVSRKIAQLQQLNAQLLADEQGASKRQTGHDSSSASREDEGGTQSSTTLGYTEELAQLVLEKRTMQDFFRCYFETAEKKCRQLMHELSQREAQSAYEHQQVKESCELLRQCEQQQQYQQQLDFGDSSVRRAILEAVSTLERIS